MERLTDMHIVRNSEMWKQERTQLLLFLFLPLLFAGFHQTFLPMISSDQPRTNILKCVLLVVTIVKTSGPTGGFLDQPQSESSVH